MNFFFKINTSQTSRLKNALVSPLCLVSVCVLVFFERDPDCGPRLCYAVLGFVFIAFSVLKQVWPVQSLPCALPCDQSKSALLSSAP